MKVLVVAPGPDISVQDVYVGWVEALDQAGHSVRGYNLNDRLAVYDRMFLREGEDDPPAFRKAFTQQEVAELAVDGISSILYRNHPELILIVTGAFTPFGLLDLIRYRGTKVVVLHTESPYEDDRQIEIAAHADLNLVNDPANLDRFTAIAPTIYMPHAYRPGLHHPGPADPDLAVDLAFVGSGFLNRVTFLEAMDLTGLDVLLRGTWRLRDGSPLAPFVSDKLALDNTDAADIYRSAKVGLNIYRALEGDRGGGWAMGPREVEMAACGMFFLREPRGEGDKLLPMLPTFTDPAEASDQLRWWLRHDEERRQTADEARAALADRTFDRNVAVLLHQLEKG